MDNGFTDFESKTEKNLRVAEQALFQMNNFLNVIDSRQTMEELMGKTCMPQIQEDCTNMCMIIEEKSSQKFLELEDTNRENIENLEKKVDEVQIPNHIKKVNADVKKANEDQLKDFQKLEKTINEKNRKKSG